MLLLSPALVAVGYEIDRGIQLTLCVYGLVLLALQFLAEHFRPKDDVVPRIPFIYHRILLLLFVLMTIVCVDIYAVFGIYDYLTARLIVDNITTISISLPAYLVYSMLTTLSVSVGYSVTKLSVAVRVLVPLFVAFLFFNVLTAIQYYHSHKWIRGFQYGVFALCIASVYFNTHAAFNAVRTASQSAISLHEKFSGPGENKSLTVLRNSVRKLRIMQYSMFAFVVVCVLFIANLTYSNFKEGFSAEDTNPRDPDEYKVTRSVNRILQWLTLYICLWYSWLPLTFLALRPRSLFFKFLLDRDAFLVYMRALAKYWQDNKLSKSRETSVTGGGGSQASVARNTHARRASHASSLLYGDTHRDDEATTESRRGSMETTARLSDIFRRGSDGVEIIPSSSTANMPKEEKEEAPSSSPSDSPPPLPDQPEEKEKERQNSIPAMARAQSDPLEHRHSHNGIEVAGFDGVYDFSHVRRARSMTNILLRGRKRSAADVFLLTDQEREKFTLKKREDLNLDANLMYTNSVSVDRISPNEMDDDDDHKSPRPPPTEGEV